MYRRSDNYVLFGILGVFVSVVAVGLAYAGFTKQLNISGNARIIASKWDIYFDNLSNSVLTGNANEIEAPTIKTKTSIGDCLVEFNDPGDAITYTFDVVNDGNFDATLTSLTKTNPSCTGLNMSEANTLCNYLTYTLRYTDSNRDVSENDSLLKGETRNITLKLALNSNTPPSALASSDVTVGGLGITLLYSQASGYNGGNSTAFHPEGVYNITYTNIEGDYPIQGYTNEVLEINFSGTNYNLIELYQGNTKLTSGTNYTYENNLLRILDVSGDIEIKFVGGFCTDNNITKLNDCIVARDVEEANINTAKSLIAAKSSPDFTNTCDTESCSGMYTLSDDYGASYYYRGIVNNNFVKFGQNSSGQDLYWRIVRVNGDNSIRLIYNGTNTNQFGSSTQLGQSVFNEFSYDPATVGYTYNLDQVYKEATNILTYGDVNQNRNYTFGTELDCTDTTNKLCTVGGTLITDTLYNFATNWDQTSTYYTCFVIGERQGHNETTCSIAMQIMGVVYNNNAIINNVKVSYKGFISNDYNNITQPIGSNVKDTDSTIKTFIDTWYVQNLKDTIYEDYLVDSVFCNDRSLSSGTGDNFDGTNYGSQNRTASFTPILSCPRQIDEYTVSVDSERNIGNGKLSYPIGLLSADEIYTAGGSFNIANINFYLNTGQYYWSISPSYFLSFDESARSFDYLDAKLHYQYVRNSSGVRPVINLNKNVTITWGNGTAGAPFTVTLSNN